MTQHARTREGQLVDAAMIPSNDWEALKQVTQLGDFTLPCCEATAVLKTSINGTHFFAHLSDECATAEETKWHRIGKAAILTSLNGIGVEGHEEVPGRSPNGDIWRADVLFSVGRRTVAIELQRSYQNLREYMRRQERYTASSVECYWLVRREVYVPLAKATSQLRLKREFDSVWPPDGIGTGMLPELPIGVLQGDEQLLVNFGGFKFATVQTWLEGILKSDYQYREGCWNLG